MRREREPPPPFDPVALQRSIDQAIRDGRHSDRCLHICGGCGQWTPVIWFVNEQGKRLCQDCAPPDRYAVTSAAPTRK